MSKILLALALWCAAALPVGATELPTDSIYQLSMPLTAQDGRCPAQRVRLHHHIGIEKEQNLALREACTDVACDRGSLA